MSAADVSPRPAERQSLPVPRPALVQGISLYAALFGMLLLLLLAVLVSEDRALRAAYVTLATRDAVDAARGVEAAIAERGTALRAFRALTVDDAATDRFERVVGAIDPASLSFYRVSLTDTAGAIVGDTVIAPGAAAHAPAALLAARPAGAALEPGRLLVYAPADDRGTIVMVRPLVGGDPAAPLVAIASMPASATLHDVLADTVPRRRAIIVRDGDDTIATAGHHGGRTVRTAMREARITDDVRWQVEVMHDAMSPGIRATFWLLGGSALLFLVLGLARERRNAQAVTERSAELERLSTELLRSNRMKSEFLANISHELRTPLNAIVGFVELLKDGVYGELSPRQVNPVDRIAGSATHLRHLVDQVLDIAKMAAGRLEVHLEPVVLRPFVLNVASELESLAADKPIALSLTVSASLPRVRTDPSHLRQILVNLVGNAIKYTPSGGAVAIRTRLVTPPGMSWRAPTPPAGAPVPRPMTNPQGQRAVDDEPASTALSARSPDTSRPWVVVQVSDTGIGIAPEHQEQIFDEFEQVDAGPRGESMQRGTGLGLPISRRLARLLGGDVTVDSQIGRGATFTVWLPVDLTIP